MEKAFEDKNLITQAEYAKLHNFSRSWVCQLVKNKKLTTVWIRGNKLILLPENNIAKK